MKNYDWQPAERVDAGGRPYWPRSAQRLIDEMKPSHTVGTFIESINALYDDEFSLYDRDLMGV